MPTLARATHPDVDTPCGQSCCGTALEWTAGLVFNVVNTCRSALWSFIRLPQREYCRDWEEEDHRKRGLWRSLALQGEGREG